jgi:hypothetical protein
MTAHYLQVRIHFKNLGDGGPVRPILGPPPLSSGPRSLRPKVRFAVGPLLPAPNDTKKAFDPIFAHLAKELGVEYDMAATPTGQAWRWLGWSAGGSRLDGAVGLHHRQ